MNRTRVISMIAAVAAGALALTACGSSSTTATTTSAAGAGSSTAGSSAAPGSSTAPTAGGSITIGSANFAENVLLMNIYADALKAKGITVNLKPKIGSREVYMPALQDGSIDLIPEYSGSVLAYFDKTSTAATSDAIYAALPKAIGDKFKVLEQSKAEDKDAVVVSASVAAKYSLKTIGDLKAHSADLIFGASPEYKTRANGIPGLKAKYGVVFGTYKTLDAGGPLSVAALKNGQIDASNIFSTDPAVSADKFVVLEDPLGLYTAQNIVPLINAAKVTPTITTTLNAISAKLDTASLTELNNQVAGGKDSDAVAQEWLKAQGLI
ncbi:osmoprotectant transport system substrate-binding protein [Nakamurella sp. UYEF19]|uniref:ABC transporter substrate-binding protein n=1 Tax=Nakamurella sp. UYEF19 TaxID=1756392 RepID=UPI00339AB6FA